MLAPAFDVLCEFLHALLELVLALPRHLWAFARRRARREQFEGLQRTTLPSPSASGAGVGAAGTPTTPPSRPIRRLVLCCGDASGEQHALRLLAQLRQRHPQMEVEGYGGEGLQQAGMKVWLPLADMNIMGFKDVLAQLPLFFGAVYRFAKALHRQPPDGVILVDYPGLHRHLLRIARRRGVPVVHYIAPQLWAWAPWRVRDFRRADRLLTILPFESDWYAQHGAQTCYVGHPLADALAEDADDRWQPPAEGRWIAILPGSRKREIRENLKPMLEAARRLQQRIPEARFVLPHMRPQAKAVLEEALAASAVEVEFVFGQFHQVLRSCEAAWVVSGTASLEVAALGLPSVVVYGLSSRLAAWLARHALTVPSIAGANLLAGAPLVPEHCALELDPQALCDDLAAQLVPDRQSQVLRALEDLQQRHLAPGTAQRAALAVEDAIPKR